MNIFMNNSQNFIIFNYRLILLEIALIVYINITIRLLGFYFWLTVLYTKSVFVSSTTCNDIFSTIYLEMLIQVLCNLGVVNHIPIGTRYMLPYESYTYICISLRRVLFCLLPC